ncbi:MAG: transposase domain-containing protein [Spirochaetales bacterium]|nr:transposase domain-containing protein [Spirochaetales bacterium]
MNPYAYLYLVFTKVPQIVDDGEWHALLPWNLTPDEINEAAFADLRFN